jgi:hypothetical protein
LFDPFGCLLCPLFAPGIHRPPRTLLVAIIA